MPKIIKKYSKTVLILGLILALVIMYMIIPTGRAATIANRSMTLSDTRPNQTGVTYDFAGDHSTTSVKCLEIDFCTTATGGCTFPSAQGMSVDSASATSAGWTVWTYASWSGGFATTSEGFKYTYATGEAGTSAASFSATNITNATSGAYYARAYSWTDTGCTTPSGGQDSGVVAFAILSGVSVSATVAETLSFSISDYAIGFGELSTSYVYYATADETGATSEPGAGQPAQLTVNTNATGGVSITIQDVGDGSNAGLYSSSASKLIAAVAATSGSPTAATEGYAAYGKSASGLTIDEGFDNDVTSPEILARTAKTFASTSSPVSNGQVDLSLKAAIAGTTPAGTDYSDTIIFVATPTY